MSPTFGVRHSPNIENREKTFSNTTGDIVGHTNQRNRNTPKHKACHLRFLTWVAYSRKQTPMDDIQRKTCPLIGCEQSFLDQETMLEHVYDCPRLWKGMYRCSICDKAERISKCHANGDCCGSNLCKDKLFTVANSLRLAKRFFSHTSKGRRVVETLPTKRETLPTEHVELDGDPARSDTEVSELAVDATTSLTELDTGIDWHNNVHGYKRELQGSELLAELRGNDEYIWRGQDHLQNGPAELSTYMPCNYPGDHEDLPYAPTGPYVTNTTRSTDYATHNPPFDAWPAPLTYGNETPTGLRVRIPDAERSSRSQIGESFRQFYDRAPVVIGSARYYQHVKFPDTLANNNTLNNEEHASNILPVSPVESYTNDENTAGFSSDSMESILSLLTPSTPTFEQNIQAELHNQHPYIITRAELECLESLPEPSVSRYTTSELSDYASGRDNAHTEYSPAHIIQQHTQHHSQRSEVPSILTSPSLGFPLEISMTESSSPLLPHYCESDYRCSDCGFEPSGKEINKKSNLKRHRKKSCKRFSPYSGPEKLHKCTYRDCERRFTRSDNLLVHRRNKGHFEIFELGAELLPSKLDPKTMPDMFAKDNEMADWDITNEWEELMFKDYQNSFLDGDFLSMVDPRRLDDRSYSAAVVEY